MNTENLQWLLDRAKIQDTFSQYAIYVDSQDWSRFQSLFVDTIERDLSSFTGQPIENIKSEQHVNECRSTLPGFDSTQHFLMNSAINIIDNKATAIANMVADHTLTEENAQKQFTIRGIYTFQFVRIDSNWKICAMKLSVLSTHGDQRIFEIAAKRASTMKE